jgi:ABC-type glutathione transport system ATPase component
LRGLRQRLQFVGGNPLRAVLNSQTVEEVLREPLDIQRLGSTAERGARVAEALNSFELNRWLLKRPLATLSLALRQSLLLARALMLKPAVLITDEVVQHLEPAAAPRLLERVSAVSAQHRTAWLWTTADLALARHYADRVLVLEEGHLRET